MKVTTLFIFALLPVIAFAGTYRETRNLELSSAGVHELRVNCGAGKLVLKGVEGINSIHVTAEIESDGLEKSEIQVLIEELINLDLRREYDRALLRSDVAALPFANADARIHLIIEIPVKMNIKIIDGSGAVVISNIVGNVEIDDDSGAIKVENVYGQLRIEDTSGDLEVDDVQGDIEIIDGSGDIVVLDVTGDVKIKDTSGAIEVNNIGGSVTVSDGSGSIDIVRVGKNVFIREAGSGEIDVEGVKGKITVQE